MKSKLFLAALFSAFLTIGAFADNAKGPLKRIARNARLQSDFTEVIKDDQLVLACKVCDAMTLLKVNTEEEAKSFCQEGEEVSCPSCETKLVVRRHNNQGPRSKGKPVRTFTYVNQHGDDCLIVSKVLQDS